MRVRCPKCKTVLDYAEGAVCPTCAVLLRPPTTRATVPASAVIAPPSRRILWFGIGVGAAVATLVAVAVVLLTRTPAGTPAMAPPPKAHKESPAAPTAKSTTEKPAATSEPRAPRGPSGVSSAPRKIATFERRSFLDLDRTPAMGLTFEGCTPRVWHADRSSILYELDGTPRERRPNPPEIVARFKFDGTDYAIRRAYEGAMTPSITNPSL